MGFVRIVAVSVVVDDDLRLLFFVTDGVLCFPSRSLLPPATSAQPGVAQRPDSYAHTSVTPQSVMEFRPLGSAALET